jgi:hypothetical protein
MRIAASHFGALPMIFRRPAGVAERCATSARSSRRSTIGGFSEGVSSRASVQMIVLRAVHRLEEASR